MLPLTATAPDQRARYQHEVSKNVRRSIAFKNLQDIDQDQETQQYRARCLRKEFWREWSSRATPATRSCTSSHSGMHPSAGALLERRFAWYKGFCSFLCTDLLHLTGSEQLIQYSGEFNLFQAKPLKCRDLLNISAHSSVTISRGFLARTNSHVQLCILPASSPLVRCSVVLLPMYHPDPVSVFTCREATAGAQTRVLFVGGGVLVARDSQPVVLQRGYQTVTKESCCVSVLLDPTEQYCDRPGSRGVGTQDVQE